ncbi:MAG TPA: tetratricopeptide repeat protein [Chthoniobacterales bacterium]
MMSLNSRTGCRRVLARILAVALLGVGMASARGDFTSDLADASRPTNEGIPEVGITRLQDLLKTNLTPDQQRLVSREMVRALVLAKRPEQALAIIKESQLIQSPTEKFWCAQALAGVDRWSDALPLFEQLGSQDGFSLRVEAAFGAAEMLRALNRRDEAVRKLTPLLREKQWQTAVALRLASLYLDKADPQNAQRALQRIGEETPSQRKEHRYLRGRLEVAQHRPDRALTYLEPLTKKSREVSHPLMIATLFLVADVHLQLKTPETGDDFLEDFVDHRPGDSALPELFAKLDELYRAEKKPVRAELERWTREPEQPRRGLAQWYLARIDLRAGRRDRAHQLLSALRVSHANRPELVGGLLELAQMELQDRNFPEAIAICAEAPSWQPAAEWKERFQFLSSRAYYGQGNFKAATSGFESIGRGRSPFVVPALYNASLGWLELGDRNRLAAVSDGIQAQGGSPDDRVELRLQEGLVRARQQRPDAGDILRKFVADSPQNPRVSEAWVALAELAFHQNPPRMDEARKFLTRATESQPTPAAKERAQYLMIWIEDAAGGNPDKVIDLAKQFLDQQPGSYFVSEVRMKLAEAYYLRQDFANARTQFELFAQQNPSSPLTEKALFFAAESAMATMGPHTLDRAIVLFDQVAQMKGDLRWAARNEQAQIERKLGKPQDALLLYDEVLKNDARPGEKREAMCGKGDIYFELSTTDPKNYERAIEAYEQLAAAANEAGHWRNQALFKKGVCLEKKADHDSALATFYQVLDTPARSDRAPELFWFYKAGFNAARLLESDSHWDSAARIYQKLVAAGGSRSEEARIRLNQLRLEHFLWSD